MALEIFGVACKAVLKVFLIAAVGCWARHAGLLDARTAKAMSKVNGTVFLPCLLFVALGRSVTVEHLRNVWLLPLAAVTNITMGACMGAALLRILRIPDGFRGPAVAASAFGNSLALPVVLISAVISSGKVGHLTFTEEDEGAALLYLGAYMTTLTIFMWSVGPAMMRAESVNSTAAVAAEGGSARGAGAHEGVSSGGKVRGGGGDGGGSSGGVPPGGDGGIEIEIEMTPSGGGGDGGGGRAEEASSAVEAVGLDAVKWDAARDTRVAVDEDDDDGAPLVLVETDGDEELLTLRGEEKEAGAARGGGGGYGGGGGRAAAAGKQQRRRPAKSVSEVCLTTRRPPLYRRVATVLAPAANNNVVASILGIVVGVIPPLRAALFEADGALYVFADAATIVSGAAIPTVIVILGGRRGGGHGEGHRAGTFGLVLRCVLCCVELGILAALPTRAPRITARIHLDDHLDHHHSSCSSPAFFFFLTFFPKKPHRVHQIRACILIQSRAIHTVIVTELYSCL